MCESGANPPRLSNMQQHQYTYDSCVALKPIQGYKVIKDIQSFRNPPKPGGFPKLFVRHLWQALDHVLPVAAEAGDAQGDDDGNPGNPGNADQAKR